MVPAAQFGKGRSFWLGGGILLALSMIGLRWRDVVQEWKKALSGDTDVETTSVADLRAAKCR